MAITSAISDLFASIYELFASIFGTAYAIVHSFVLAIFNFIAGILNLAGDLVSGVLNVSGSVGKFIASNIVILAVGALGAFAYVRYTAQGQRVAAGKKTS